MDSDSYMSGSGCALAAIGGGLAWMMLAIGVFVGWIIWS